MKIMLPVDGSDAALAAVQHALAWVDAGLRAHFDVVNVQVPPSLYEVVTVHDAGALDAARAAAGAELLAPAEALLDDAGLDYESEVAGGDPGHVLAELIENYGCRAVVMGAIGAGDSASALGGVALALLHKSPVPVTVVRPQAVAPELVS